jgi:hypothetical protein
MDAEQIKALIEAIKNKDGDAALAIAEAMLVSAASGEAAPGASDSASADPLAASAEPAPPSPEEEALEATLTLLTGADGPAERNAYLTKLVEERKSHAERVATLELSSRFELVSELVKLGVEFPSTAFVGDPKDRKLVARLSSESIPDLRARVAVLKQAKGAPITPPARKDPAVGDGRAFTTSQGVVTLSASEIKNCEDSGAKLETYAENKAIRESARRSKVQK